MKILSITYDDKPRLRRRLRKNCPHVSIMIFSIILDRVVRAGITHHLSFITHIFVLMGKKILAFGASTSRASINKQFATYAASRMTGYDTEVIDLNDFPMPLFSVDVERSEGAPDTAYQLKALINATDGLIISFAEHNGAYSAAFKNTLDWLSRLEGNAWAGKPALLLSTSPGGRGGSTVLGIAVARFPFNGGKVAASFSLPSFRMNFSPEQGITDPALAAAFETALDAFIHVLENPAGD